MSRIIHCGRREFKHSKIGRRRPTKVPRLRRMRGHGKEAVLTNGPLHLQEVLPSVANLLLLISRSAQIQSTSIDFLFPETSFPCPVAKFLQLPSEQQELYIHWICRSFGLRRDDKDPRIYCAYCDMNNHPRFACKHVEKHKRAYEKHHCTLCSARHPPFLCPRAQVNGGKGQTNWYKQEYKRAKSENRPADYRWGEQVTHIDVDGPESSAQQPQEVPAPQCAAAAMMHGISMAPASSLHGGRPPIAENQEYSQPSAPPGMYVTQREIITNCSQPLGSQCCAVCSSSKSSLDVHSSLQHNVESTLSYIQQAGCVTSSREYIGSQLRHIFH